MPFCESRTPIRKGDPMPTPFHAAIADDLAAIMADPLGMAEDVRLLSPEADEQEAKGVACRAIFQAPGQDVTPPGASAPVVTVAPQIHIPLAAVESALGRPLSTRDRIYARGRLWRVHNPQDLGRGLLRVTLLAVGGAASPGVLLPGGRP